MGETMNSEQRLSGDSDLCLVAGAKICVYVVSPCKQKNPILFVSKPSFHNTP